MRRRLGALLATASLVVAGAAPAVVARADAAGPQGAAGYRLSTLVKGAAIHGANGLAIDRQGRLLVASAMGAEIVGVQRSTGQVVKRWGHAAGVDSPDDVAVGPDGSVYWTDLPAGEVGRRTPDGKVTKQFVGAGVNPIAFSPSGRLFVARAFLGDGLYELDPALQKPPRVVIPDSGKAPFPNQLNGFDFSPGGQLFAPQPFRGRIVKINPDTGAMRTVTGAFAKRPPTSVEFDSHGRLYASLYTGTIVRVNRSTGAHVRYANIRGGILDNMVFSRTDRLYVSNSDTGALYTVSTARKVSTLTPGGLILPGGLALMRGSTGRTSLFASDIWSVPEYNPTTGALIGIDRQSRAGGGISDSWSLARNNHTLIITSWFSNTVQLWNPVTNKAVATWKDFKVPVSGVRFQGDLVVAQLGDGTVVRAPAKGARETLASGLTVPAGLLAAGDSLYVSDWATGTVWQIAKNGVKLATPVAVATKLAHPEGMVLDTHGRLLVVESGAGRLTRVNLTTGAVRTVARGLATGLVGSKAAPPTWALAGVAVRRDGTVFVSGDRGNVIYKLSPTS
ncbi:hypothetical protein [Nocardioides mesophilus]|uniref:SMP-30/gluconolactonase/LRE family protein n=1 Tax=Nocardioides mesophilus TaxID=433659 RepID=A0A7G9REG5_9ACTN|nr:hypothetical protein [Nocardioides mesophilus]QNN53990.1 hypothetical protein H9L09_06305 [Nocardioides mesophilus]